MRSLTSWFDITLAAYLVAMPAVSWQQNWRAGKLSNLTYMGPSRLYVDSPRFGQSPSEKYEKSGEQFGFSKFFQVLSAPKLAASLLSFVPRLVRNSHHQKDGKWSIGKESIDSVTKTEANEPSRLSVL